MGGQANRFWTLLALILIALPAPAVADKESNSPKEKIWDLRIDELVIEPPGWTAGSHHETGAVAFSPDDKRVAVTIVHVPQVSDREFLWNTHLLIIDVQSPKANVRRFDLTGRCGVDLTWSQSGEALLVCGALLRLADGTSCVVSPSPRLSLARYYSVNKAFWFDSQHVVRSSGAILNMACQEAGNWPVPAEWRIGAVAALKNWVLLWHWEAHLPNVVSEFAIADRSSDLPLSGWARRRLPFATNATLAVGAGTFCSSLAEAGGINKPKLHCSTINGGHEIKLPKELTRYELDQSATFSTWVVAEKWQADRFDWLGLSQPLPRVRSVFDLSSGRMIASWKPRMQHSTSPTVADWPYHCALSSTGEYVAESGDGSLELYRIVP